MDLNPHRLRIFLQVVELGGFSAAAGKLFMSQSSVSHQVRRLETALGAVLIDRSGGRATATAEGEVLAEYARRMFLLGEEAVTAVRQIQGLTRGHLHLGGTTTVGTYLLPRLLGRFQRRHPAIEYGLFVGNVEQLTERLLAGEVGLGVFAGEPAGDHLQTEQILLDLAVVVAAPDHPLAGRDVPADLLADERFILREHGSGTRALQGEVLTGWRLHDVASMEMWGTETVKQAVRAGLGISLLSEHTVRQEVENGLLVTITVHPAPAERPIVVAHRRDRVLAPTEHAFLDTLRELHTWPVAPRTGRTDPKETR